MALYDRVKMTTATTGTGTITLGSASSGYQSFAGASVPNGASVSYVIEDGTAWEAGTGVYTSSGTTMTRTLLSSSTGSLLSLTGSAVVFITPLAKDLYPLGDRYVVYDASSTYTFPTTGNIPKSIEVLVFAGGAGGGSGRRGAAGSACSGGGPGGPGGTSRRIIPAADVPSGAITVTVGAGGAGGAAVTADGTNGNVGTAGGNSAFGSLVEATGGAAAAAAAAIGLSPGVAGLGSQLANSGQISSVTAAVTAVTVARSDTPAPGGPGGGVSTGNVAFAGAPGCTNGNLSITGGPAGGAVATAGSPGTNATNSTIGGGGGAGGGAGTAAAGGAGGAGAVPGGGGGGGGASRDGFNSGAGGAGGGGRVIIIERYGA